MLSPTWITDHTLDEEYKRYVVLSYAQEVDQAFSRCYIQPHLDELSSHIAQLESLNHNYEQLKKNIGGDLLGLDWKKGELKFAYKDAEGWELIEQSARFALEKFYPLMQGGKDLLQDLELQLEVFPLGIVPLYKREGYLLLTSGNSSFTTAYYYHMPLAQIDQNKQLNTEKVDEFPIELGTTYMQVKRALAQQYDLPNPAVFVVTSSLELPLESAMIPIASHKVIDAIS